MFKNNPFLKNKEYKEVVDYCLISAIVWTIFLALLKYEQHDLNWHSIFHVVYIPVWLNAVLIIGNHFVFKKYNKVDKRKIMKLSDYGTETDAS